MENTMTRREARENAFLLAFSQTFGDVPLEEALAASREEGYGLAAFAHCFLRSRIYLVYQRVTDIFGVYAPAFEVLFFEGEDYIDFVYEFLELFDAALSPRPDFGRDIVRHFEAAALGIPGHPEIEPGIVYQDEFIGLIVNDILFAKAEISDYPAGFGDDLSETHHGGVGIVSHRFVPCGLGHSVASPETDLRILVPGLQPFYQDRPVKVARCFSRYYIILCQLLKFRKL